MFLEKSWQSAVGTVQVTNKLAYWFPEEFYGLNKTRNLVITSHPTPITVIVIYSYRLEG